MCDAKQIEIRSLPEISAIYYALLQCGYDFYVMGRNSEHIDMIQKHINQDCIPTFFSEIKQTTCEVYPYWPRAAILESASFCLRPDFTGFQNFEYFHSQIMSAGNITDKERGKDLWDWIVDFPEAIQTILNSQNFIRYMHREIQWVRDQNYIHRVELKQIQRCLDLCINQYNSPVRDIQLIINPIKCVYSADYHIENSSFVFVSGMFQTESIIHEFLHHVVHPVISLFKKDILEKKKIFPSLDSSYYGSGNDTGYLNAFEEYAVRKLTKNVIEENYPKNLASYLAELL